MGDVATESAGRLEGPGRARVRRTLAAWLILATLLGAGLRLHNLGAASFWIDEVYTIQSCADLARMHRSKVLGYIPTTLGLRALGIDPEVVGRDPSAWKAAGITEWRARLGSCVVGIATIPLLGLACRRMLGVRGAGVLSVLLAANPWHIYWSQAARFYTLEFLFYSLSLVFYFTATERGSRTRFALAMLFLVLAVFSQPPALVILAVMGADWASSLVQRRPVRLGLFGWVTGAIAVGLCAGVLSLDVREAPDAWGRFVSFTHINASHPPLKLAAGIAYITGPALIVTALGSAWWLRRRRPRLAEFLLFSAVLPIVLFALWSLRNAVGSRYAFICLFGWVALAAAGVAALMPTLRRAGGPLLALAPLVVLLAAPSSMLLAYYTTGYGFHPRWRAAYEVVRAERREGDVVTCRHTELARYYLPEAERIAHTPRTAEELASLGPRVWMVVEADSPMERPLARWLHEVADLRESLDLRIPQPEGQVRVYLYDRGRGADAAVADGEGG